MKNIQKIFIFIALILFAFSGIINQALDYFYLTNPLIILSSILLVSIIFFHKSVSLKIFYNKMDIFYLMFIFWCIISAITNRDSDNFVSVFKYLVFYLVLNTIPRNDSVNFNTSLYLNAFTIASITGILLTVIRESNIFGVTSYSGIFANPNNFGVVVSASSVLFISLSLKNAIVRRYKKAVFFTILSMFSVYLVAISASRTSFLALLITISIVLLAIFNNFILQEEFYKSNILNSLKYLLFGIILIVIVLNSPLYNAIQENIILKLINKSDDLTSGRTEIWLSVIQNSNLLGAQSGYIKELIGFSAHNSFLYQIGQFGWIAGLFYILFWITGITKVYIYFVKNYKKDPFSYYLLMSITLFMAMSMTEVLTHTFSMYMALYSISYVQLKTRK